MDDRQPGSPVPPLSLVQRCWFIGVLVGGLVFLVVLPPYQGADEYKHWLRAWTVADGQMTCGELPASVTVARRPFLIKSNRRQFALARFDEALQGVPDETPTSKYNHMTCAYPPFPYAVQALVIRLVAYEDGKLEKAGLIKAFYAARVANWLCLCLVIWWFLRVVPWCRNTTLFFFSIPEVIEQTSAFNTDLSQFILMFVMLAAMLRTPTWRRIAIVGVAACLLTTIKPVFALLGLVALPALLELRSTRERTVHHVLVAVALFIVPILCWKVWATLAAGDGSPPPAYGEGVNPGKQLTFLIEHKWHVFRVFWVQFEDFFGHNLMRGSWTSVLGGFGPARLELPMQACYLLVLGLGLAIYADLASRTAPEPVTPRTGSSRLSRISWAVAASSIAAIGPGSVLAMFLFYTPVASYHVYGVQGRYYLTPMFMLLVLAMRLVRWRWPQLQPRLRWSPAIAAGAAFACLWAVGLAIVAIGESYWYTG